MHDNGTFLFHAVPADAQASRKLQDTPVCNLLCFPEYQVFSYITDKNASRGYSIKVLASRHAASCLR